MKQDEGEYEGEILFYKDDAECSIYSNFYPAPIYVENYDDWFPLSDYFWQTSEHYYQAMKFKGINKNAIVSILGAKTPSEAYRLGWESGKIRDDWDFIRNGVMRQASMAKFEQNEDLRGQLLETKGKRIVQVSNSDLYWGESKTGKGMNMLGVILMSVRDELLWKAV